MLAPLLFIVTSCERESHFGNRLLQRLLLGITLLCPSCLFLGKRRFLKITDPLPTVSPLKHHLKKPPSPFQAVFFGANWKTQHVQITFDTIGVGPRAQMGDPEWGIQIHQHGLSLSRVFLVQFFLINRSPQNLGHPLKKVWSSQRT